MVLHIKLFDFFKKACLFQAAAMFTSLPFLVGHGLALSHFSLAGNILFNPIILIFMMLGAAIFFSDLLGMSMISAWMTKLLELLCFLWHKLLGSITIQSLFYLSWVQGILMMIFVGALFRIGIDYRYGWARSLLGAYFALTILLAGPVRTRIENWLHNDTYAILTFKRGSVFVQRDQAGAIIIKNTKAFKKCCRSKGFFDFELKPALAKRFGKVEFLILPNGKKNCFY